MAAFTSLIPQNLAAWPTSAKRVPPDGGYG